MSKSDVIKKVAITGYQSFKASCKSFKNITNSLILISSH